MREVGSVVQMGGTKANVMTMRLAPKQTPFPMASSSDWCVLCGCEAREAISLMPGTKLFLPLSLSLHFAHEKNPSQTTRSWSGRAFPKPHSCSELQGVHTKMICEMSLSLSLSLFLFAFEKPKKTATGGTVLWLEQMGKTRNSCVFLLENCGVHCIYYVHSKRIVAHGQEKKLFCLSVLSGERKKRSSSATQQRASHMGGSVLVQGGGRNNNKLGLFEQSTSSCCGGRNRESQEVRDFYLIGFSSAMWRLLLPRGRRTEKPFLQPSLLPSSLAMMRNLYSICVFRRSAPSSPAYFRANITCLKMQLAEGGVGTL